MFPVYRKYENNKHFFKITSDSTFEELMVVGTKISQHHFKASIYPDKLRIQDMINKTNNHWINSTEKEWQSILENVID